jgi:hypothetical protein
MSLSAHSLHTHFLTLSLPLADLKTNPVATVETALRQRGEPLRWAITQVDEAAGLVVVEAVVTTVG